MSNVIFKEIFEHIIKDLQFKIIYISVKYTAIKKKLVMDKTCLR